MRLKVLMASCFAGLVCFTASGQWPYQPPGPYYDPYTPGGFAYPVPPGSPVSDLEIRNNLTRAFFEDQMLNSVGIRVRIFNGVVTLQGRTDTPQAVSRAVWHAYNAGAQYVINQVNVRP